MNYNLKNIAMQVTVEQVKRVNNSKLGNPRYELVTELGNYKTAPNAGWVYGVNFENLVNKTVLIDLDGRGNITRIEV